MEKCEKYIKDAEEARKQSEEAKILSSKSNLAAEKAREMSDLAAVKARQQQSATMQEKCPIRQPAQPALLKMRRQVECRRGIV